MKRILLSAFLLLSVCLLHAQVPQYIGGPQGYQAEVFKAKKYLVAAPFADTPTIPTALKTQMIGTIVLRMPVGGDTAYWGWIGYKWIQIGDGGGGGGGAVSSVFGRTGAVVALAADYNAFYPLLSGTYNNPSWLNQLAWSKITGTPTSLAGYGITDPIVLTSGSYANPAWITSLAYSKLTGAPSAALTKVDDTNITLTLGGSPSTSLLAATSLTLGWTGQLAATRGGSGVNNAGTFTWGSNNITFTTSGATSITLPTSGTVATLAGTETFTNKTLTTPILTSPRYTVQALTDGATITCDMANGAIATVTLGGNRTLAFSNLQSGQHVEIWFTQDGTGGRTITLPAGTKVIGGGAGAVTLTTAAGSLDILTFSYVGTTLTCNYGKNYN